MAERSRNLKAIAFDVAEGLVTVNPLFLKSYEGNDLKALYTAIARKQSEIRSEPFPYNDILLIRKRNMRLQRLHAAMIVMKNAAREKNINLF